MDKEVEVGHWDIYSIIPSLVNLQIWCHPLFLFLPLSHFFFVWSHRPNPGRVHYMRDIILTIYLSYYIGRSRV